MINAVGTPQSLLLIGGTSDIALAIARLYAESGRPRVVLAARPSERRDAAEGELRELGCTVSAVDFGAANSPKTNVGGEHPAIDTSDNGDHDPLVVGLRKLGHQVDLADQSSGLSAIVRDSAGLIGGADPRREGLVMGDAR